MIPEPPEHWLEDLVKLLCYSPHGGGGYSFTRADVLDMSVAEALYYAEWLDEQRTREARALRQAARRR